MNDLTTLSDNELEMELAIQEDRIEMFNTPEGKKTVVGEMVKLLAMIEKCGYKIDTSSRSALAKVWAGKLKKQIIRIGFTGVQEAALRWIQDDRSNVSFPKVAWIEDKCVEIHGDPRVEKGRRDYERRLALIEQEHQDHIEEFKRNHPEDWERITKEAEVKMNECNR